MWPKTYSRGVSVVSEPSVVVRCAGPVPMGRPFYSAASICVVRSEIAAVTAAIRAVEVDIFNGDLQRERCLGQLFAQRRALEQEFVAYCERSPDGHCFGDTPVSRCAF